MNRKLGVTAKVTIISASDLQKAVGDGLPLFHGRKGSVEG